MRVGEEAITWFVYNITFPPLVSMETVSKSNRTLLGKLISWKVQAYSWVIKWIYPVHNLEGSAYNILMRITS